MGVALGEDGHSVGLFQPKKVWVLIFGVLLISKKGEGNTFSHGCLIL